MKPFGVLKAAMMFVGLAAGLILSPACKAQSEIAPDHFDGTDSWQSRARKVVPRKPRQTLAAVQGSYQDLASRQDLQFSAKSESFLPERQQTRVSAGRKKVSGKRQKE